MNRRSFFTRASAGLVGAFVASNIPTGLLPAKVRKTAALDFLRQAYNDYSKGTAHAPKLIFAGQALYDAAKAELIPLTRQIYGGHLVNARYEESLMFKGATLRPSQYLEPWSVALFMGGPNEMVVIRGVL